MFLLSSQANLLVLKNNISIKGSPYLRRSIRPAANRATFGDPVFSDYYHSLRATGKQYLTVVGAVARKLCNIIFAVLRDNKPYQPMPKN